MGIMQMFDWLYMDYEGQKTSEWLYQRIVLVFAAVGFLVGYYFQMFSYTVGALGLGSLLATLICGIPWGCYRKNPIKWQPDSDGTKAVEPSSASHSENKKQRKNK